MHRLIARRNSKSDEWGICNISTYFYIKMSLFCINSSIFQCAAIIGTVLHDVSSIQPCSVSSVINERFN